MLVAACLIGFALIVAIDRAVATAPLGWQDEDGWHEGEQPDLWLARVARGALSENHVSNNRTGA